MSFPISTATARRARPEPRHRDGYVVQSPRLAAQVLDAFAIDFAPENAWRIAHVVGTDDVAWVTQQPAQPLVEPHDPASAWRRFMGSIWRILPGRGLL